MDGGQAPVQAPILASVALPPAPPKRRGKRLMLLAAATLLLAGGGAYGWHWWTTLRFFEETEDAYLAADSVAIGPRIAGQVAEVLAADNQRVEAGQLLARLDDADLLVAQRIAAADVQSAAADIESLQAQITLQSSTVEQAQADVASTQAQVAFSEADAKRYSDLLRTGSGTVQRSQQADADIKQRQAGLARSRAALDLARGQVGVLQVSLQRAEAQSSRAKASLAQAGLNLGYARITAPVAGVVGDRSVRPGQTVAAGTRILDVVPLGQAMYVTANYKETQLRRMMPGQTVTIVADMLPGTPLCGRVDSFAPGSGSTFALLPPENATGNFTKVVQRVTVRITLDPACTPADALDRLRPGLSVLSTVDTRTGGSK